MKRNLKCRFCPERLFALALSIILAAGTFPGFALTAKAAETSVPSGWDEIAAQAAEHDDPFAPEEGYLMETREGMPSSFDLRHVVENGVEHNYVTPVKLQYPYGTCWGFSAISAAETSILAKYSSLKADTLDLSEKQVTWFNANPINDTDNPQNGEGYIFEEPVTVQNRYDAGGTLTFATNLFAQGVGPTAENTDTSDGNIYSYKGRNGEVINNFATWYDDDGKEQSGYRKAWYSEDDDWSIPEKYRFRQNYSLKESYMLPSPSALEDDEKEPAVNAIKEQLLQKRAVSIEFYADNSRPGEEQKAPEYCFINLTTWAQYTDDDWSTNHAVTIIGYDDHYPKTNFVREAPGDGAWLVKNSWGSDFSDFPNNGYRHWGLREGQDIPGSNYEATSEKSTGYFWLSYYDQTVSNPEAFSFETAGSANIIDQHDFMPVMEYEEYTTESENKTANIFTAGKDQTLTDISFITTTPGTSVSFRIFTLSEEADNPEEGECIYSSEPVSYPYGGFHRISLPEESRAVLPEGQKYSVVVTQKTPSGKYSISFAESDSEEIVRGHAWFKAVVNEGESYLYVDSKWNDLSDPSVRSFLKDEAYGKEIDNFSIKAYSVPADNMGAFLSVKTKSGREPSAVEDRPLSSYKYTTSIRGAKDDLIIQPEITWTVSDPEIASVEVNKDRTEGTVNLLKYGETVLTVDAGIYGKKEIPITVRKLRLIGAQLPEETRTTVYTGNPYEPVPVDVYGESAEKYLENDYTLRQDEDYTVSYENNVLCGRGDTVINGINRYGSELRTDYYSHLDFRILPAKAEITGITPGKSRLSVQFKSQKDTGISGYELSYKETGTEKAETMRVDADAKSASIIGLEAGKTYDVSLKAYVTVVEEEEYDYETESYIGGPTDYFGEASDVVTSGAVLPGNSFDDVNENDYFFDAVNWAVRKNITKGTSDTSFSPAAACTRGQAVTFLWRAHGSEKVSDVENPFTDVKEDDYFYDAVLWAIKNEVTNGLTETSFGPEETCTRGQIVTFLWRAEGKPEAAAEISFTDVDQQSFCYEPVRWAVEKEITQGTSEKTFSPEQNCTRGQIVTFLYRGYAGSK